MKPVINKLQVRHYPQVPCTPFCVNVANEQEAKLVSEALAYQHLFLFENNIIPDYSNAVVVVMWDEQEQDWVDYYNEAEGMEWDEFDTEFLTEKPE